MDATNMNNHYRDWPRGKCPGPLFNRHWPGQECWDKGILNINLVTNKIVHCVQIKNVLIFHAQVEQTPLWKLRKHVRMSKGILLKWRTKHVFIRKDNTRMIKYHIQDHCLTGPFNPPRNQCQQYDLPPHCMPGS